MEHALGARDAPARGTAAVGAVGFWRLGPWRRYFVEGAVRFDDPRAFYLAPSR